MGCPLMDTSIIFLEHKPAATFPVPPRRDGMNGNGHVVSNVDCDIILKPPADLLTHKYRPKCTSQFKCHTTQAERLKQWIVDFNTASSRHKVVQNGHDDDDDYSDDSWSSDCSEVVPEIEKNCVLLTGPPGVGKTSLVYTVANELKMHVVESHSSERRDFKLFRTLKLANQKGKINPIANLFQFAQVKQEKQLKKSSKTKVSRRKRRKFDKLLEQQLTSSEMNSTKSTSERPPPNQCLSLSGDSSIVLFDDIDVVFDEDGPFLKSLVEFIKESKRPVVLTATQSIDYIRDTLIHFEHIHLGKPVIEDCAQLLEEICEKERHNEMAKISNCRTLARRLNCDIRQCLNNIHFYGDQANAFADTCTATDILPDFCRLSEYLTEPKIVDEEDEDATDVEDNLEVEEHVKEKCKSIEDMKLLDIYHTSSLTDLMDSALNFSDKPNQLTRWLECKPSHRYDEYNYSSDLGEQIKKSIVESALSVYDERDRMNGNELLELQKQYDLIRQNGSDISHRMNLKIRSRIEPPDKDFYTDIVPMLTYNNQQLLPLARRTRSMSAQIHQAQTN